MRCFFRISLLPPPPPPCTLPSTAVPKTRTVKTTKISLVGSILLMLSYVNRSLNLHFSPGRRFIECQPFRDCRRTDPSEQTPSPDSCSGLSCFRRSAGVFVRAASRGAVRRWDRPGGWANGRGALATPVAVNYCSGRRRRRIADEGGGGADEKLSTKV